MRTRIKIPEGLYGITGDEFSKGRSNLECVKEMIEGGIRIIQYRAKNKTMCEKLMEAKEIKKICSENDVIFIVNDHVDLAILVGADGVHVGQDDLPPREIRKLLGPYKIIGLSTHGEAQGQKAYGNLDVDYIGVGPIFPTTTKNTPPVGLEYLDYVEKNLDISYVAIGGIKEGNIDEVLKFGAKNICLVSEIVGAENIREKVEKLNKKISTKKLNKN